MNVEKVQKHLEELQMQAKQQEAVLFQLSGAIQDCNYWLKQLEDENAADQINDTKGNE